MTANGRCVRLVVSMGDPAGIGPEICLRLLARMDELPGCEVVVVGHASVLAACARATGLAAPRWVRTGDVARSCVSQEGEGWVWDVGAAGDGGVVPGEINAWTGAAAYEYVARAMDLTLEGWVDGMVTGPIHKEALAMAGVEYPGHTEILAARTGATRYCMMLTSTPLTCSLVTTHVGLGEVAGLLTRERIVEVIELTGEAMRRIRGRSPRLMVLGLNPHAGERGLFGAGEEERLIGPAVEAARAAGWLVRGPISPDTAFLPRVREETDAYICMYHDQGLIPLKMLAFDRAVNVTLGLPIVRTSVDHGTALDIAWRGRADAESLMEAVRLAWRLARKNQREVRHFA